MRRTERYLLRLGEEVVGISVEHQAAHDLDGHQFLRHQLGCIEDVEAEFLRLLLGEDLQAKLPLGIFARFDGLPEISPMKVGIGS